MKKYVTYLFSVLLLNAAANHCFAADTANNRMIDAFTTLDAKSTKASGVVAKIVTLQDPVKRKVLEITVDFDKPGAMPTFTKFFPPGLIDPRKYSGISFQVKSNVQTEFAVWLAAYGPQGFLSHADGSPVSFLSGCKPGSTWTEVIIPFEKFSSMRKKVRNSGEQNVYQEGVPIPSEDYAKFNRLIFTFRGDERGTSTIAEVMIKDLCLVTK
jgi:hypothetical protein